MKRALTIAVLVCFAAMFMVTGCGPAKAGSSQEAIQQSQTLQTVKAKADYLIAQAKAFYGTKQYQDVVNLTNYVIQNVDATSAEAKALLEKAKAQVAAEMKKAAEQVKAQFSGFGKK